MVRIPRSASVALGLAAFASPLLAQSTPGPRRREAVSHSEIQAAMAAHHAGYNAFRARTAGEWMARFDEEGGNPALIIGSGIRVSEQPIATIEEAETYARQTLEAYSELWGAPIADLHLVSSAKAGPLYVFTWEQRFDGLVVEGARVRIQVHEAGRISALGTTAVALPREFSRTPKLRPDQAEAIVRVGKTLGSADRVEASDFVVFPVRSNGATTPHLAFAVDVLQPSRMNFERVFVDADAGNVLEVRPLAYDFDVKGKVSANVIAGLNPADPVTTVPLEGARVSILHGPSPLGSSASDVNGDFLFPTALPGPFPVTTNLGSGPWFAITPLQGAPESDSASTTSSAGFDQANLVLNGSRDEFGTSQTTAAFHLNGIRSYATAKIPDFVAPSRQRVFVNSNQPSGIPPATSCTSQYNSTDKSLTFYAAGGGCVNTAYSTVVYHEYGHAIDDSFGGILSSALSEGLADTVAMYATGQPIVGEGYFGPGTFLRSGENDKTWPAALTSCASDPHCIGQTFMGFAWNVRKNLTADLGGTAGASVAEKIVLGTFTFNDATILDAVTQVFLLDDDDGDLSNGIPHYVALAKAATTKGFIPPALSTLLFPKSTFSVNATGLNSLAIGDLNGDGTPDLATANYSSFSVSVLLGNGFGGFAAPTGFNAGFGPTSVAIGDLNGDGKPDLATANNLANTVSVLLGNGLGSFGAPTQFGVGSHPRSLAIGDLNGDGKPDLATANNGEFSVSVLLGDGLGGLGAATNFGIGQYPSALAIGELSGDGKPDLAIANELAESVSVLFGDGLGSFGAPTIFGVGSLPRSLAIGDLNGDGKPDLATANFNNKVSVLIAHGLGGFGAAMSFAVGSSSPTSVAIGDLNGDGKPDLATANLNFDKGNVSVLAGNGVGGFGPAKSFEVGPGSDPVCVAIGDLNGDGKPDLATANGGWSSVSVLLGNGLADFGGGGTSFGAGSAPWDVAIGDLNGDGKPDLAVTNFFSNKVSVLLGNGLGGFGAPAGFGFVGNSPSSIAIGDLNGDGKPDLVTANIDTKDVSVLLGNGLGSFGAPMSFGVGGFPYSVGPYSVAIGDLNGDGNPDLATANYSANTASVLLGNGFGGFGAAMNFGVGGSPRSVAIVDLNGDGKPDLALDGYLSNSVSVLLGDGLGGFGAATSFSAGSNPQSLAIGDLNGDGMPDAALAHYGIHAVTVLPGNGLGGFGLWTGYEVGAYNPISVAIGDLNGDGKPDLATANVDSNDVSVLLEKHVGLFGPATTFKVGLAPRSVAIGDLNGDGKADLAASNSGAISVSVLLNQEPVPFGTMPYGTGTFGCDGILGLAAASAPAVGNHSFAVACSNAPRNAEGRAFLAGADDLTGTLFPGLGLVLHVDLSSYIGSVSLTSDAGGSGYAPLPIANDPSLAGLVFYVQAIWFESANQVCSKAALGLVSSKGLKITIQP